MTVPLVILTAALDRRVLPNDLTVYVFLYSQLDCLTFRPLKHAWLSHRLGIRRQHISSALGRLLQLGYLAEGPPAVGGHGVCTYRLTTSPPDQDRQTLPLRSPHP